MITDSVYFSGKLMSLSMGCCLDLSQPKIFKDLLQTDRDSHDLLSTSFGKCFHSRSELCVAGGDKGVPRRGLCME